MNTTGLAAQLVISPDLDEPRTRTGCITAKATFAFSRDGSIALETDAPVALFDEDVETPLGILPSDLPVRRGSEFEFAMLGCAYAPGGRAVEQATVVVTIGARSLSVRVLGDRLYAGEGEGAHVTDPAPFVRMPLTWERTFGGSADVWLDPRSMTQVMHAANPRGRGFDPTSGIERLSEQVYTAPGFPRTDYQRTAPNLLPLGHDVSSPDASEPVCFSIPPADCGVGAQRVAAALLAKGDDRPFLTEAFGLRALGECVFDAAPLGQRVVVQGCAPDGDLSFVVPATVPLMEYRLGEKTGARHLTPQLLVLLAEERRFYIVYRDYFRLRPSPDEERSARLRFD